MINHKISVIVPSYNREATIERCIKSILNQSYKPYEIIIVDDGSTDHTIEKIKRFDSDLLKVIVQDHLGAQAARNRGIRESKGEFIAFLDSDDEWFPNNLEKQIGVSRGKKDVVVYTNSIVFNGGYETDDQNFTFDSRCINYSNIREVTGGDGNIHKLLLSGAGPMFSGMLVSKEALENIGYLDEKVPAHQEWETSIRLSKICEMIQIKEPLFVYYTNTNDSISDNKKRDIDGYEYIVNKHKNDMVRTCGKKTLKEHYKKIFLRCLSFDDKRYVKYALKYLFV